MTRFLKKQKVYRIFLYDSAGNCVLSLSRYLTKDCIVEHESNVQGFVVGQYVNKDHLLYMI